MSVTRIVHLTTAHPVRDVRIFEKECRTLAEAGYAVTLIAPHDGDTEIDGVSIRGVPRFDARWKRMTVGAWKAYRTARDLGADIYHLHDPELLPWARLLRRRATAVIFDMHEDLQAAILTKEWLPRWARKPLARIMGALEVPLMRGLAVVFAEKSYAPQYPWVETSEVVLNLPPVERLLEAGAHAEHSVVPLIGYVDSVNEERGSVNTLEALQILSKAGRSVGWECVGAMTSSHRGRLERFVDEAGLTGVRFHGYQLVETCWRLMAGCAMGLAVLHAHPNYVTSYPTKMFEYMALGLPVIASDFPLWREVVEAADCGLLVRPDDPQHLAEAISYLLDNPAEAQAMGARGKAAVIREYNWTAEAAKLLLLYRHVLGGPEAT